MSTCPVCPRRQDEGLLCHSCTTLLEKELGEVPALVAELNTTLAKQGRDQPTGKGGLASERIGYHPGASLAADYLGNTLTTWARDLAPELWNPDEPTSPNEPLTSSAAILLDHITEIRRHSAVAELHDEIISAIAQARSTIDRPANRTIIFVGPCPETSADGGTCDGEVYAYIPTEDDRPSRMECRTKTEHKWTTIQWMRTGKRILDRIEQRKREKGSAA